MPLHNSDRPSLFPLAHAVLSLTQGWRTECRFDTRAFNASICKEEMQKGNGKLAILLVLIDLGLARMHNSHPIYDQ
jgi:hypothetical protein